MNVNITADSFKRETTLVAPAAVKQTPAGLKRGEEYIGHCGEGERKRRLKQLMRSELRQLQKKHGVQVGLDGRLLGTSVIVEPARAEGFDVHGVIEVQGDVVKVR